MELTQKTIKNLLEYDEYTGIFTWKVSRKGTKGINSQAGTVTTKGYVDVCIDGKKYGLHRLAFLFKTGDIPTCVDHRNGVKSDNRWENLRPATYSENGYNYKGTGSATGFKNVYYDPRGIKKYFVVLVVDGRRKSFGYFHTPEEASAVAKQARTVYHKDFSHD